MSGMFFTAVGLKAAVEAAIGRAQLGHLHGETGRGAVAWVVPCGEVAR